MDCAIGELVTAAAAHEVVKVAVMVTSLLFNVIEHGEVEPVHVVLVGDPPVSDQPAKVEPEAGVAARDSVALLPNCPEHVVPQLIPPGLDVTVPVPLPALTMFTPLSAARYGPTIGPPSPTTP